MLTMHIRLKRRTENFLCENVFRLNIEIYIIIYYVPHQRVLPGIVVFFVVRSKYTYNHDLYANLFTVFYWFIYGKSHEIMSSSKSIRSFCVG